MSVLRIIVKILLIPVVILLTVIQWIGIFLNSVSSVILGVLAFIFVLTGIASLAFRLAVESEALKMIVTGFIIFMVPVIGEGLVIMIATVNAWLHDFMS